MSENQTPFLSIRNLVVQYTADGEVIHAVNECSFELAHGRTLGLVGETGAGKTTIAKAVMRILPDPPAKICGGEIKLDGQDLLKLPEAEMRKIRGRKISMIFQDPMTALNPVMKVGRQIAEVIQIHSDVSKHEAEERAKRMLELVGIPAERYTDYPHQFSGGMKQRVVIAIALACSPDLLLADEPTTALDVTIQAQVLKMIGDLKKQYNMSMLLITHDLGVIAEVCDDVAIIYAGQIVEYGTREQIFDNPLHPYTRGLFQAIPNPQTDVERLVPIEGMPQDPTVVPAGCSFADRCPAAQKRCREMRSAYVEAEAGHFCRCFQCGGI